MNSCIKYILFTRRLFLLPPLPHHPLVCCSWPRDSAGKSRNFYCWKTGSMTFLNCKFALSLQSLLNWLQQWWIITDDQQQLMYCGTSILTKGNTSLYPPKICKYCSTSVLKYCSTCLLTSSIAWEIMCGASREVTAPICKDGKDITDIPDHQKQTRSSTQCEQH